MCSWERATHASVVVPGGMRATASHVLLTDTVESLQALTARLDVLLSTVMLHRVWAIRLGGVGITYDAVDSTSTVTCMTA